MAQLSVEEQPDHCGRPKHRRRPRRPGWLAQRVVASGWRRCRVVVVPPVWAAAKWARARLRWGRAAPWVAGPVHSVGRYRVDHTDSAPAAKRWPSLLHWSVAKLGLDRSKALAN